jgi:hypothetical protein
MLLGALHIKMIFLSAVKFLFCVLSLYKNFLEHNTVILLVLLRYRE